MKKIFPLLGFVAALLTLVCSCHKQNELLNRRFAFAIDSISKNYGYADNAFLLLDSLNRQGTHIDDEHRLKLFYYLCGYYHVLKNDNIKAMLYADSMLLLMHNTPQIKDYNKNDALVNISKGDILFATQEYNAAYRYYYLGKRAAEKSIDACTYSEYSYRLGMVMYKKRNFTEAARYFKQAFSESTSCRADFSSFFRQQEVLNNTALSYKKGGMADSGLFYYDTALIFINTHAAMYPDKQIFFETARGVIYGNVAQLYEQTDPLAAERFYNKSININTAVNHDINDALLTQIHLAQLYYNTAKWGQLVNTLQNIHKGLDTIKNDEAKADWNNLMWKYQEHTGNLAVAFYYLKAYNTLKDSIAADSKKLDETDVASEMRNMEATLQMDLLRKDASLNQSYFFVAAVLFIMTSIILLQIIYNGRKTRQNMQKLLALNNQVNDQNSQLEKALDELGKRNKEKDRILGIVAHDLRSPVAGIGSLISLIEEENEFDSGLQQIFNLMREACANSIELINEILEFAMNDDSIGDQPKELVDMNAIAGNCAKMLQFKASEKSQTLLLEASGTPEMVLASQTKMWRVVSNLVTNAIKFSPPDANIIVHITHADDKVQLKVQDKGIGIPDNIKDKVFDIHTEAKRLGTNGEKPFGLGLSICRQIVEAYKGEIWFESTVGKGTTFYVNLPKADV